jgi:hypothetical protein
MDHPGPRKISAADRIGHSLLALCLLVYGATGLYYDDIYVPGKHGKGMHFHGLAAWVIFGAFVCAALNLTFIIGDHCDDSSGNSNYYLPARTTQVVGWALFAGAIACQTFSIGTSRW